MIPVTTQQDRGTAGYCDFYSGPMAFRSSRDQLQISDRFYREICQTDVAQEEFNM
jgi:hypothetical protein